MERALLEGEQQIQIEQLDAAEEKVAALECKERNLLSEAEAERNKVRNVNKIRVILTDFYQEGFILKYRN